ncbi:MAG: sulfatase-like hydrolase/transferase, partial [Chloroflexi bacterium]|nr:sulfatase-like hydrolase/transferase [Chloroflexota bacterium]
DEAVERLVRALEEGGKLDQTVNLFTSDNGLHLGAHRIGNEKLTPYEESIRVPLIVCGPGVAEPGIRGHLALNIDLAPTIAELAGMAATRSRDGRSLVPLLGSNPPLPEAWRQDFLIENWEGGSLQIPPYHALRTRDYLFVEYQTGERELYDLRTDPFQLESLHDQADPALIQRLSDRLNALRRCAGARCREWRE